MSASIMSSSSHPGGSSQSVSSSPSMSSIFRETLAAGFESMACQRDAQLEQEQQQINAGGVGRGGGPKHTQGSSGTSSGVEGGGGPVGAPPCWSSAQSSCFVQFIEPERTEYYPLLDSILHRELQSMICNVSYHNTRSGSTGTIDALYVRTISTTAAAYYAQRSLLEGAAIQAEELHLQPYCHVYIAGCDGMDHYRSKVRPAIQKFVQSMGEGFGGGNGGGEEDDLDDVSVAGGQSNTSTLGKEDAFGKYMILYVPTKAGKLASGVKEAFGRNLEDAPHSPTPPSDPLSAAAANASSDTSATTVAAAEASAKDREMLRKFNMDFPGKTVMLSTLLDVQRLQAQLAQQAGVTVGGGATSPTAAAAAAGTTTTAKAMSPLRSSLGNFGKSPSSKSMLRTPLPGTPGPSSSSNTPPSTPATSSSKSTALPSSSSNSALLPQALNFTSLSTRLTHLIRTEFDKFLTHLGAVMVLGFQQRRKTYEEELRRQLDAKRLGSGNPATSTTTTTSSTPPFEFRNFVLVKESLAFTYEQMRLFREALLQYEELSAFVPEEQLQQQRQRSASLVAMQRRRSSTGAGGGGGEEPTTTTTLTEEGKTDVMEDMRRHRRSNEAWRYAIAGDTDGFRKVVRTPHDTPNSSTTAEGTTATSPSTPLLTASLFHQYFFARQCHLLFQLHLPVEVVHKAKEFVMQSFGFRIRSCVEQVQQQQQQQQQGGEGFDLQQQQQLVKEAESWALQACWDVKYACEHYFSFQLPPPPTGNSPLALSSSSASPLLMRSSSVSSMASTVTMTAGSSSSAALVATTGPLAAAQAAAMRVEKDGSRQLSELLEFARQRLLRLGDLQFGTGARTGDEGEGEENPIRKVTRRERPLDVCQEGKWIPWKDLLLQEGAASPTPTGGAHLRMRRASTASFLGGSGVDPSAAAAAAAATAADAADSSVLSNAQAYEAKYLELSDAIVKLYAYAGRKRSASRLLGEQSELFMHHGDYASAANILRNCSGPMSISAGSGMATMGGDVLGFAGGACARDGWHALQFWRIFRLAYCQRMMLAMPASQRVGGNEKEKKGEDEDAEDGHEENLMFSYLMTLSKCFHPKFAPYVPKKAAHLFQDDVECLIREEKVGADAGTVGPAAFLESDIAVEPSSMGRKSLPLGFIRKKLTQSRCHVGEKMNMSITLTSHLPRKICVEDVRLFVVALDAYERANRGVDVSNAGGGTIPTSKFHKGNSFRILSVDEKKKGEDGKGVELNPGSNVLHFRWIPMTVGQYVLAAIDVQWGFANFHHESAVVLPRNKPVHGIEVLPSDSTMRVELHPLFLIPGEEQEIRLAVQSRDDIITEGVIELFCSEGLKVMQPHDGQNQAEQEDEDGALQWLEQCSVSIGPIGPDSTKTVRTLVKSHAISSLQDESDDPVDAMMSALSTPPGKNSLTPASAVQTLRASVVASYHHRLYKELTEDDEPEGPPMETTLEAMVTTLDRPALTFNTSDAFTLSKTSVMVSVSVLCNTPTPFFIKEWEINFPPPLQLAENGDDANSVLVGHPVALGQEIFFGFSCRRIQHFEEMSAEELEKDRRLGGDMDEMKEPVEEAWPPAPPPLSPTSSLLNSGKPTLCVVLRDDQGKTFRQVLTLNLDSFYEKMKEEDEYSGINTAAAELHCSADEGVVGAPVQFTYKVDTKMISDSKKKMSGSNRNLVGSMGKPPPLLYSVACDEEYWVLGGNIRGTIPRRNKGREEGNEDEGTFAIDFRGIPTRSGLLKHFPEISVYYAPSESYSSPSIAVHCHVPESFMSLSFKNHMALAAPASLDTSSAGA